MTRHARSVPLVLLCMALFACDSGSFGLGSKADDPPRDVPVADAAMGDLVAETDKEGLDPGPGPFSPDGGAPIPDAAPAPVVDWEAVEALLEEIRASSRHQQPTPQDAESRGIYPKPGETEARSEPIMPPFVIGPRRQTDSMVRQLYSLLPLDIRRSLAFVVPDRIVQNPDAYLPYLRSRQGVVVVGNFVGIGKADTDQVWFVERHDTELEMAELTLRLVQALGLKVHSVRYTMGDSISGFASTVRARLQTRLHAKLDALALASLKSPVTWGADEAVPVALAATLPERTIRVRYANENARHHYDGNKTSPQVVKPKLAELGLREVNGDADLELVVLNNVTGDDGTLPGAAEQRAFDEKTFDWVRTLDAAARQKLVIVDGRMFNGSLDAYAAPRYCDYLAYGAWGTFANKVGTTLATAKIVLASRNAAAGRALLLEAVAHDVFANGYRDGRDLLQPKLSARGVTFAHFAGYSSAQEVEVVFEVLNTFVADKMQKHFADSGCLKPDERVRFTPQLWRTFESEAHLTPTPAGAPAVIGVFRTDLPAKTFDPRAAGSALHALTLDDLVHE